VLLPSRDVFRPSRDDEAPPVPDAPRVSVLLPARNAASTLDACIESLARQTEPRWECVAVDDASTDDTGEKLEAWARLDRRVRVLRGAGRGLVAALELGRAACRAPLVARMDADDWMHRDRLRLQLDVLAREPGLAGVGSHVRLFPRAELTDGHRRYERWLNSLASPESVARDAFVECPIAHPTLVLRREILDDTGYRECGWPEDHDLLLRLLGAGHRLAVVPRRLLAWRDHEARLSRRDERYGLARFTACKAEHLTRTLLRDHSEYVLWGYGPTAKAMRKALLALGRSPSHIVELHPRRLGRTIHGAPVIAPDGLPSLDSPRIVVSVSGPKPRAQIRDWMRAHGFDDGGDFVCTA